MAFHRYAADIQVAHKTACTPDWRWENPAGETDALTLWCVTDGVGTLTLGPHAYSLRAGDCFLIRMWDYCLGAHDPAHPLTVYWATFRYRDCPGRPPEVDLPAGYRHLGNLHFFSELYARAIDSFNADSPLREQADPWMRATLAALDEEDRHPQLQAPERELYDQIQRLCARMQAAPGRAWHVAALAEEFHVTPGHFTRLFRRYSGQTPREFLVQARIDAAKSLLYLSNHSITRIAELLGYRDVFYFSRHFREQTGLSPSAFRKR